MAAPLAEAQPCPPRVRRFDPALDELRTDVARQENDELVLLSPVVVREHILIADRHLVDGGISTS
jgi:hypothetical protein